MQCTKVKYSSEHFATLDIKRIKKLSKRNKIPCRTYYCKKCKAWHLTSKDITTVTRPRLSEGKIKYNNTMNNQNAVIENEETGFEPVNNEFPKFWDFETQGTFIGKFVEKYSYDPDKSGTPEWEANTFVDKDGFKWNLSNSYQITQAIEKNGQKLYKIEFVGKKKLEGGKTVNEYKIGVKEAVAV